MHDEGHTKPVLWDNSEAWGREGVRKGIQGGEMDVHPWVIYVDVWQNTTTIL